MTTAWFEQLFGFREESYAATRARLEIVGERLHSRVNGASYGIGRLELPSLAELRARVAAGSGAPGRNSITLQEGDVRRLHSRPENAGALFQVASQFNLLEMIGPDVTPEDGVTRYAGDPTQGPACALAAAGGTLYRNYFVPLGDQAGQTAARQLDTLAPLGQALSAATGRPPAALWTMRNGYAFAEREGLGAIGRHLASLAPEALDALRGLLRIGLHHDVEVTDDAARPLVSQAYCSALPIGYNKHPIEPWEPFARLVLEAAYEATLLAAVLNARRGASRRVLLTLLGGGVFRNPPGWIHDALRRALTRVEGQGLEVILVSFGQPSRETLALAAAFR